MHIQWFWLVVSLLPYTIERQKTSNMQSLVLSALLWQFSCTYQKKQCTWSFSLPWIKHVQQTQHFRMLLTSLWTRAIQTWVKKIASR